jgi:hypothetical protein
MLRRLPLSQVHGMALEELGGVYADDDSLPIDPRDRSQIVSSADRNGAEKVAVEEPSDDEDGDSHQWGRLVHTKGPLNGFFIAHRGEGRGKHLVDQELLNALEQGTCQTNVSEHGALPYKVQISYGKWKKTYHLPKATGVEHDGLITACVSKSNVSGTHGIRVRIRNFQSESVEVYIRQTLRDHQGVKTSKRLTLDEISRANSPHIIAQAGVRVRIWDSAKEDRKTKLQRQARRAQLRQADDDDDQDE